MTALEKITAFVGGYPGADILREFQIDYTDQIFINGGALPPGLVEIRRKADLMGRVAVVNQYNFGLHCAAEKAPGDGAAWLTDFKGVGSKPVRAEAGPGIRRRSQPGTNHRAKRRAV